MQLRKEGWSDRKKRQGIWKLQEIAGKVGRERKKRRGSEKGNSR